VAKNDNRRDPCGDGNFVDFVFSHVNSLVVLLSCSFARYYHREN
jgi:hypothetical protein